MRRIIRLNESEFKQLVRQMINEISVRDKYEKERDRLKGMDERTFEKICSLDCTTTDDKVGKYCNWLLSKFDRNRINNNDYCEAIRIAIEQYNDGIKRNILVSQGISKDINSYKTVDAFIDAMDSIMDYGNNVTGADIKKLQELEGQYEIVGESANWYIVNPKTWEAERYFGSNTKWCTVGNENFFDRYTNEWNLYITMPKNKSRYKERMQFHFEEEQFADVYDRCFDNPKLCIANTVGEGKDFEEICAMWEKTDDRFSEYKYTKFSDVPRLLANGVDVKEVFDEVEEFENGYAHVKLNEKWNFIGTDGKLLSDMWFDYVYYFCEDYAMVVLNDKYNFISTDGKLLSDKWFDDASDFSNGYGYAKVERNGKWNYIDTDGKPLSDKGFDWVDNFFNGYAKVERNGKFNFIGTDGKPISPQWYDDAKYFQNGYAAVFRYGEGWNLIDTEGKPISPQWYDNVDCFYDGYAEVKNGIKWNFIDTKGKELSPQWYDGTMSFRDGFARVRNGEDWYFIDTESNLYDADYNLLYTREQLAQHPLGESIRRRKFSIL